MYLVSIEKRCHKKTIFEYYELFKTHCKKCESLQSIAELFLFKNGLLYLEILY